MSHRYYRKLNLLQTALAIRANVQTLHHDTGRVWPVGKNLGLEICQVHNSRFDDAWLCAGWVVYTTPIPKSAAPLTLDWHYSAATIELYEVPTGCALYFNDGQEPGGYAV